MTMRRLFLAFACAGTLAAQTFIQMSDEFLEAIARRSPIMANRIFQFVRAVCRWAVREEILSANPAEGLQKPRKDRQRERVLRDEEVLALWRVLDGHVPGLAGPHSRLGDL